MKSASADTSAPESFPEKPGIRVAGAPWRMVFFIQSADLSLRVSGISGGAVSPSLFG